MKILNCLTGVVAYTVSPAFEKQKQKIQEFGDSLDYIDKM
jgi:hypothetical protein